MKIVDKVVMNNKELEEALLNKQPVIHKNKSLCDIEYERVCVIIYTEKDGKIKVSAELMDKCGYFVCRVRPCEIRFKEDK